MRATTQLDPIQKFTFTDNRTRYREGPGHDDDSACFSSEIVIFYHHFRLDCFFLSEITMPHTRNRNPSPIPEVTWDTGLKEMNETWKGAIACLGVAIFFVMTIGIIYWQVVDQPNKNWILKGSFSGLIWERRTQTLVIQTLTEDKTFAEIDVENVGNTDIEVPFVRNMCWLNKTEFCYTWDSVAEVKISLESEEDSDTECYSVTWTPIHCHVDLKVKYH